MRRGAFTLIEVMAVVVLIGLLATATAWSLAGDLRRSSLHDVMGQISHSDHLARMTARNTGQSCVLRFDLDAQTIRRITDRHGEDQAGHAVMLPTNYQIECVLMAPPDDTAVSARNARARRFASGNVDIGCSPNGLSPSYAVALAGADGSDKGWLVFSGLTGQATWIHDEREIENLLALLTVGRPDPH